MKKRRVVVLDTNCLVQSISQRSNYYPVWKSFIAGEYDLCVSSEILEDIDFSRAINLQSIKVDSRGPLKELNLRNQINLKRLYVSTYTEDITLYIQKSVYDNLDTDYVGFNERNNHKINVVFVD